jgi:hypothetical protein
VCGVWQKTNWSRPRGSALLLATGIFLARSLAFSQSASTVAQIEPASSGSVTSPLMPSSSGVRGSELGSTCVAKLPADSSQVDSSQMEASPYPPLSTHCKLELFARQTYSPYTFASVTFEATWAQTTAQWPQYGGGMPGWGKRLGATLTDTESRRFIQGFVLSSAFHQDPRYFPSRKRQLIGRAWYAATRVLITRSDAGESELNSSELFGALSATSLQNLYYPRPYRTFGGTINRFLGALSSDATSDILHEFTPDLKRLFHKHAPKKIQELAQKIPMRPDDRW